MARKSSTFYKLQKDIGDGYKSVWEFHTVVNGNMYCTEHEERPDGSLGWLSGKNTFFKTKAEGNERYQQLKKRDYTFAGIYEMDIFGKKTKIK